MAPPKTNKGFHDEHLMHYNRQYAYQLSIYSYISYGN